MLCHNSNLSAETALGQDQGYVETDDASAAGKIDSQSAAVAITVLKTMKLQRSIVTCSVLSLQGR
jgi:hypothetical protein